MSKYSSYQKQAPRPSSEPHAIWRGIGCTTMLILPIVSYAISVLTVDAAMKQGIQLPASMIGYPVMPEILFRVPGLVGILSWIQGLNNLYAYLVMAFFVLVMLLGVLALVYAFMYRVAGPSRYTQYDAPPSNAKVKKYRR